MLKVYHENYVYVYLRIYLLRVQIEHTLDHKYKN